MYFRNYDKVYVIRFMYKYFVYYLNNLQIKTHDQWLRLSWHYKPSVINN